MKLKYLSQHKRMRAQTMMEYIILIAIVAIASIPVAKILGNVFRSRVMSAADAMVQGRTQSRTFNDESVQMIQRGRNKVDRDMSNFGKTGDADE